MHQSSVRTQYEKRQLAFYQCLKGLQSQETVEGMGHVALHFLRESFQFDLIWIAQYEPQYQVLSGIDGTLPNAERDRGILQQKQPILPGDLFDQVLLTGTLTEVPNLKQEQRAGDWQVIANRQNIQGTVVLPIRYRQRSLGIVLVGTTLWGGHPRSEEMIELKMFAGALGSELDRLANRSSSQSTERSQLSIGGMSQILAAATFDERLKLVLEQVHGTLQPSRACLYWFDGENQVCRLHDIYVGPPLKRAGSKSLPHVEIPLQAIAAFYQNSLQNQLAAISDVQGLLNSNHAPTRLMNLTRSRAWLSAPIVERGRLIAVLAAEANEPRLWSDTDKQSIQLLAQLMGQGDPNRSADASIGGSEPSGLNGSLNVLRETYQDSQQWDKTLLHCLELLGLQFAVRWAAILTHHPEDRDFRCRAQFCHKKKQPLPDRLPALSEVDAKMLGRMSETIAVQSLEQDLRLMAWRQSLSDRGAQSFLLLKLDPNAKQSSFLLLATDLPRTWTPEEIAAAGHFAGPLEQALSQRNQWLSDTDQVRFMTILNQGLQTVQQTPPGDALFTATAQALHQLLEVECVAILRWSPDRPEATIAALRNDSKFHIDVETPIDWKTDSFLQRLLSQAANAASKTATVPHLLTAQGSLEVLAAQNSGWLTGMGRVEMLSVPLQIYPDDPCLGLVLVLDSRRQNWSALRREGIQLLTRELAAHHRSQFLLERLTQKQETLECLNWYKQRHLEHVSRLWTEQMPKFQSLLSSEAGLTAGPAGLKSRNRNPAGELYQAFNQLESILKTEVWELQLEPENLSVATLLRRSLERIEEVTRVRQLWTQVHNLTPSVSLQVSGHKLELMLVELLLAACYRSKVGDRIDIWCRALPEQWVEISITDNGRLNPLLIQAIRQPVSERSFNSSVLESAPGLHFKVCQSLVERFGGQIELAQLEDGRALSRLILPLGSPN
ncbi:GAF domain-containing protein [Altericista sp. CCNU0014]|uniref:GAF domain-containing protein n=1 Tax=Altericista sp. CCNU0014 TaxID=3082949 RepID=UPI00384BCD01